MPGLPGSTGHVPAGRCPPCPTLRPFPRAPRPPSAQKPRVSPAKPRPETVGNGAAGPSIHLGSGDTGQAGLAPSAEGSRCPQGAERGPGGVTRRSSRARSRYREAAAEQTGGFLGYRRRHGASSAAPRGKSPRQEDGRRRAGTSRLPPPAIPHLPRAAAGQGRREVALGTTHLTYKSLPFGLKVTNWVGNTVRARPQFAMATPETPRVPTRVRGTP